jgi:hypothetical protein
MIVGKKAEVRLKIGRLLPSGPAGQRPASTALKPSHAPPSQHPSSPSVRRTILDTGHVGYHTADRIASSGLCESKCDPAVSSPS